MPARLHTDRGRLVKVLSNLLSNAVEHSPSGATVILDGRIENGDLELTVTDQGPGVPQHERPRLFERYFKGSGEDKTGAGLGLSIAKGIVHAHGGRIWLDESHTDGARFCFSLPLDEHEPVSSGESGSMER